MANMLTAYEKPRLTSGAESQFEDESLEQDLQEISAKGKGKKNQRSRNKKQAASGIRTRASARNAGINEAIHDTFTSSFWSLDASNKGWCHIWTVIPPCAGLRLCPRPLLIAV